ncbi:MAG: glutathione S-transferase family protein [Paracoccaceae bacterium]
MLTLYGAYRSRASRPLWLLAELGLPFTHIPVIQAYRLPNPDAPDAPFNTASPAFLAINPQGQIPAMTDGDLTLTESLAITQHIARTYGATLGPANPTEAALFDQWAFFAATSIETPALDILYTITGGLAETPNGATTITTAAEKLSRPLARLEAHLQTQPYLLNRFTAADIMVAECLRYAQDHAPLMDAHPATSRWLAQCQSRPAFQTMWANRLNEPS